jgi:GNAT superfamily N-acetyltransferase
MITSSLPKTIKRWAKIALRQNLFCDPKNAAAYWLFSAIINCRQEKFFDGADHDEGTNILKMSVEMNGDRMLGWALIVDWSRWRSGDIHGIVSHVFVRPECRSRGIGTKLLKAVLRGRKDVFIPVVMRGKIMKDVNVECSLTPDYNVKIQLSKRQLKVLQDALGYSAWQFEEGGADPKSSITLLNTLHDEIKKQTGLKSSH